MFIDHPIAALLPTTVGRLRLWLFQLGGLGLIPLGVLDNSLIPLPGTMDAATIVLSARQEQLWLYYAFMATVGTVIGGFVTYRIARKGGRQVLKRRFSSVKVDKVCEIFGRWGFGSIAISALLSPPVPIVPFLLASGATHYPVKEFLFALTLGRISRYMVLAYFSARPLWKEDNRVHHGARTSRPLDSHCACICRYCRELLLLGKSKGKC
jgi:membrane protein YqaA with SNARE-associated domain